MPATSPRPETTGPALRLLDMFRDPEAVAASIPMTIGTWPARLLVWSAEAWARIPDAQRPADAIGPRQGFYFRLAFD